MREFTFLSIRAVYQEFLNQGYEIISFLEYLKNPNREKVLILRHDVDRFPKQSLKMAQLEHDLGVTATYYFRIRKTTYKPDIINEIKSLGHEIGYHYENLTDCNGNYEKSIADFEYNLNSLREYYHIETICMHGSPMSKWDNKLLWSKYDYKKYGLIAATSFDIDYDKFFYISDNGWGWNNTKVSVRDKVKTKFNIPIENTQHLIDLVSKGELPNYVMINAHPDTFFDDDLSWFLNKTFIKSKNVIKKQIVKYNILK